MLIGEDKIWDVTQISAETYQCYYLDLLLHVL